MVYDLSKTYYISILTTGIENYKTNNNTRIFYYCLMDSNGNIVLNSNNLDDLFIYVSKLKKQVTIYNHCLDFYVNHIETYLLENKYTCSNKSFYESLDWMEYSVLRNNLNYVYNLKIRLNSHSYITFLDSAKLFNIPIKKLVLNFYENYKETPDRFYTQESKPTKQEFLNLVKECNTIRQLVNSVLLENGISKMTRSAYAFYNIRKTYNKYHNDMFDKHFYKIDVSEHNKLRKAYFGGIVYLKENIENKVIENVDIYDVNSSYSSSMRNDYLPYGEYSEFEGLYRGDKKLYIQKLKCGFKLKEQGIPFLAKKWNKFKDPIYSDKDLMDDFKILHLTNIDLKMFFENYYITTEIEWLGGWEFNSKKGMFKEYIDDKMNKKIIARQNGNFIDELNAKLDMNAGYGKFGQSVEMIRKTTILKDEMLDFNNKQSNESAQNYLPLAIFIASNARKRLMDVATKYYDRLLYTDTDSVHLINKDLDTKYIPIDRNKLGFWKLENRCNKVKYIAEKTYLIEKTDGEKVLKASGVTDEIRQENADFEKIYVGCEINMKQSQMVKGGAVRLPVKKTLGRLSLETMKKYLFNDTIA